ncbi:MAG: S-layer homology domain-containing protein, partial [Clostridia bacterium]|nr:S-layer homology domain-containing protein [Clostridia bacterium]
MKQRLRRSVSVLLAAFFIALPLFSASNAYALQITDLDQCADYAKPAVEYLIDHGIIEGTSGRFNPTIPVTREQMVKMLVESRGIDTSSPPDKASFIDVQPNQWSFRYVEAALKAGIIMMSSSGRFYPYQQTTREQMATMFVRSLGLTSDQLLLNQSLNTVLSLNDSSQISDWALDPVEFSLEHKLMLGTGSSSFSPADKAERQQAAVVLYRFIMARDQLEAAAQAFQAPPIYPCLLYTSDAA